MATAYDTMTPPMITSTVEGPRAWRRETIQEDDWKLPMPDACLEELARVIADLQRNPLPMLILAPHEYQLAACRELMQAVRARLDDGPGVVVIDRLPVEQYEIKDVQSLFWLLGSLLVRPVAQTIDGQMMVDVRDTGIPKRIGVRGFRTTVGQPAHVDNGFNHTPPDYVSLCCLHQAVEGGVSRFVSFYSVHNRLLEQHPDLLPRLYRPFYQDRQGDFWPDESQTLYKPIFTLDPDLRCRYSHFTIPAGYQTAGVDMDPAGKAAFEAMSRIIEAPDLYCEFTIEPGQLQVVNNRWCGHGRTAYTDHHDPAKKRHLLRLWHRDHGRRCYSG